MDYPLPIPDEYLKAIGLVAVRWNYMDMVVNLFLIHLLGKQITDDRSHIIFAHTSFPQKMDMLSALVEQVENMPEYSGFREYKVKVQPLIKTAQTGRNSVIHSHWGMKDGNVMRASISARGSLKLTWVSATIGEIKAIQDSIADAYKALSALLQTGKSESRKADGS